MSEEQEQEPMSEGARLRATLDELTAGNSELKAAVKAKTWDYALRDAGYDPESAQAKALVKTYDERDPVTPEAIAAHAEGLGFSPTPVLSEAEIRAQMRAEGEQRLSMVVSGSIPMAGDYGMTLKDKARRAAEAGDWEEHSRINAQMLQRLRQTHAEYGGGKGY